MTCQDCVAFIFSNDTGRLFQENREEYHRLIEFVQRYLRPHRNSSHASACSTEIKKTPSALCGDQVQKGFLIIRQIKLLVQI